ncbi:hypothetical protein FXF51_56735 [Nonomuraea sp. PA05]|uniref:hypothetical protein n=1 Tax=Nonomuraea sp. PA05 TaxID=2604466 RepID=UPI0011D5ED86|nr:hypothetical protein [Nonomuraea sp. PA05]TYB50229.1 hypothetical protein FXF51_56735 [Nonomuraea sp. PA05]
MATGTIILPIGAADLPDGSASNAAPDIRKVKSSASAPSPYFKHALFDAATKEQLMWSFRMPEDYASTPVLKVQFKMASAVTGNVVIEGRLAATTPGDATDQDAKAFAAANTSSATAVPATTAGKIGEISLALANADSLAAGDFVVVYFARDAANASDSAAGDMEVVSVALTYTTT